MPDQIEVKIEGINRLLTKLNAIQKEIIFKESLNASGIHLARWIKTKRLSGPRPQYLGVVTGMLRGSIGASPPVKEGSDYYIKIGTLFADVPYARIHEYGGETGRDGSVLIPARPYLKPSLTDQQNKKFILNTILKSIRKELDK